MAKTPKQREEKAWAEIRRLGIWQWACRSRLTYTLGPVENVSSEGVEIGCEGANSVRAQAAWLASREGCSADE